MAQAEATAGDGAFHNGIHHYGVGSGYGDGFLSGAGYCYSGTPGNLGWGCGINYGYYGYGGGWLATHVY